MSKKVIMPITNGFEEIEAITIIDILRRAGAAVTVAALEGRQITGAHNIEIKTDAALEDILNEEYDLVVLAGGGKNADSLGEDKQAQTLIKRQFAAGKLVAAICAAPLALHRAGAIKGEYTCFSGCEQTIGDGYVQKNVVENGNVITSRGPGTAGEFALALAAALYGKETADKLKKGMYY
ncbi:MAG: DJ-1/PfpI family protein [Helicobacteraceae bacterium]|jgi:4-methyl-5(b-hydroxyethyl)-thiazole monophosphate biosynthesis|nr:DJ-1/PfpI family protein [Helicobacteraceae bacterium]